MSFEELLKNLQAEYLSSLPAKIANIREQLSKGDPVAMRESFHKLKGTGRTYGLPEVSELAAAVEEICAKHVNHASTAVQHALGLLEEIHSVRVKRQEFPLENDSRFQAIRKLLQS